MDWFDGLDDHWKATVIVFIVIVIALVITFGLVVGLSELIYPGTYDAVCFSGGTEIFRGEVVNRWSVWWNVTDGQMTRILTDSAECILTKQ